MLPLFKVIVPVPLTAVTDAEAPQPVSVGVTGFARNTFAGRLSVRDACVSVILGSLLLIEIVNRLISPTTSY